ncbi:alpha/beta hydrolase [uncultured Roseobacter sp.]|uniref:alpha/beta fold hydrolase n=1 Tax=uncultured Roseobacter sp. TaxID=114847 RepID=UPI002623FD67|nr:alpha/beta hydrolase [uncultured Roseobacter sp.]
MFSFASHRRALHSARIALALLTSMIALPTASVAQSDNSPSRQALTQFFETGDTRYAYRQFGQPSDVPLVMLIRYRANMDDWDPAFLDALARERTVIVFNQSGVSSSTGNVPDTIGGMAADVTQFAQALGHNQIDVLGWSMAGFTAQAIAIDHPDLVRRVIMIGTGPAASNQTPPPNEGVFDVATKAPRADGKTTYSDADRTYLFFTEAPDTREAAQASFDRIDAARRADEPVTGEAVQAAQTAAILDFWLEPGNGYFDKLRTIQQPAFIINGDRDAFFTVTASEILYREIPNSRLAIFPMAGHGPQHQHPELIATMIDSFLD